MTTFKDYPYWSAEKLDEVKEQLREICNIRKDDITQIQDLPNVFIGGRLVGRVPSSSADIVAGDKVGDINFTPSFMYVLVDNAGAGVWRRVALSSW